MFFAGTKRPNLFENWAIPSAHGICFSIANKSQTISVLGFLLFLQMEWQLYLFSSLVMSTPSPPLHDGAAITTPGPTEVVDSVGLIIPLPFERTQKTDAAVTFGSCGSVQRSSKFMYGSSIFGYIISSISTLSGAFAPTASSATVPGGIAARNREAFDAWTGWGGLAAREPGIGIGIGSWLSRSLRWARRSYRLWFVCFRIISSLFNRHAPGLVGFDLCRLHGFHASE